MDSSNGVAEAHRLAIADLHEALNSLWNVDDSDTRGEQTPRGTDAIDGDAEAKPTRTDTDKITGLFLIFQYQKLIKWVCYACGLLFTSNTISKSFKMRRLRANAYIQCHKHSYFDWIFTNSFKVMLCKPWIL